MADSLDRIDLKILRLLQKDGRLTNAELADSVAISPATCHRRLQRLFRDGYFSGVRALVDPSKVDLGALVMVGVVLDRSTPDSFADFEAAAAKLSCVLDCHLVAGDFDYFLKIRVGDMADFNRIHGSQLIALPGVRQTRTFFVMKEVVDNRPLDF
ncbi:Lrp/AsnC family transcriptional regulator [Allorhizobium taibaishanense]|uniref:AsnC family transcriptional regulator n=1 Tax=Allorhizobium taibaishanense TaxID=887144 RepID=A0A1Q9A605_9HYPH|nr:Lrp/AsnC ligand binding domain-containing protein [Allorhizobium taibaishanense]MBB4008880.1 Lrp/AsnC family leucine-responsive transcriptional regulator [Allorhizobium taibaishanense]OLP50014.1 AsnC family transcriptional regulator [Allorhizobium taibaishanense]